MRLWRLDGSNIRMTARFHANGEAQIAVLADILYQWGMPEVAGGTTVRFAPAGGYA